MEDPLAPNNVPSGWAWDHGPHSSVLEQAYLTIHHLFPARPVCYRCRLALHSDAKGEVPKIPEITENPEVLLSDRVCLIILCLYCFLVPIVSYSLLPHCLLSPLTQYGVPAYSHYCLVSYYPNPYCSTFLIVLAYYTALYQHSISSSTFLYRTR